MEEYKQKYRQYLSKALEGVDTASPPELEAAYARLRAANERMLANNPRLVETGRDQDMRAAVDAVIEEHANSLRDAGGESTDVAAHTPASETVSAAETAPRKRASRGMLAGAIGAIVIAGLATALLSFAGVLDISTGAEAERKERMEQDYQAMLPVLESSIAFLGKVEADILRRQKEAPADLVKVAGANFVRLRSVDKKLAAGAPRGLPSGTEIILRATDKGYKILFTGPLCRVASIARSGFVDPKGPAGLECTRFGVWNAAGAGF